MCLLSEYETLQFFITEFLISYIIVNLFKELCVFNFDDLMVLRYKELGYVI